MSSLTTLTVVYYLLQPVDIAGMKGNKYTFQFNVPSHQICHKNGKSGVEFFKKIPTIKGLRYNCKTKWLS